jgi:hypothetical protein
VDTETLVDLAHAVSREQFIAQLPHRFLVLATPLVDEDPGGFATRVIDPMTLKKRALRPAKNVDVIEVVKAAGNPYPDRISIGRARNCDVVLRDPSVSKLHAHFRVGVPQMELVDIDSQNGTLVNGRKLAPHQPAAVSPGDQLTFGNVVTKLVDANALYDLLR